MLLEGTTLGRPPEDTCSSEAEVEIVMAGAFEETPGLALVYASVMNIDRLVTIYRAALRSKRILILDLYAASVLRATANPKIPQAEWERVRVYLPASQKWAVVGARAYEHCRSFAPRRVYPEDLAGMAGQSVMLFRTSMVAELEDAGCLTGARLIYSLWPGYLKDEKQKPFLQWLEESAISWIVFHTSGHAPAADLFRMVEALRPESVVPIHTEVPERYACLCEKVQVRADREWWAVGGPGKFAN